MRKTTAKLVRDGIPDIIATNGDSYELEELAEPDYLLALRATHGSFDRRMRL